MSSPSTTHEASQSLIFHDNGQFSLPTINRGHVYWQQIKRHLFKQPGAKYNLPENLDIFVCHNYARTSIAERSLERLGIHNTTRLGKGIAPKDWRTFFKI
ncbi:MAG: hypothetical protein ACKVH8_04935 [Pirellulales bacterium]